MPAYSIHEAATKLSVLVAQLEAGDEAEIVIARDGKPVAKLLPFVKHAPRYRHGVAKGKFLVPDDIDTDNDEIAEMFGFPAKSGKGPCR